MIRVLGIYSGLNKNECKIYNLQWQYEKSRKKYSKTGIKGN